MRKAKHIFFKMDDWKNFSMLVGSKILASINSDLWKLGNNRMLANETGEAKVKIITNLDTLEFWFCLKASLRLFALDNSRRDYVTEAKWNDRNSNEKLAAFYNVIDFGRSKLFSFFYLYSFDEAHQTTLQSLQKCQSSVYCRFELDCVQSKWVIWWKTEHEHNLA